MADPRDYFTSRITQEIDRNTATRNKFEELQRASREKAAELRKIAAQQQQFEEKNRQADSASWVGKLAEWGLVDPDSITAKYLNFQAAGIEGTARVGTNLVNAPLTVFGAAQDSQLTDEHKYAWNRVKNGEATEADLQLLNTPEEGSLYRTTPWQRLERMEASLGAADTVREATDISGIVHRGAQRELDADLREGYQENAKQISEGWEKGGLGGTADVVSGVAGLLMNLGSAAVSNPQAAAEHIASNIPQILAAVGGGGTGMALTNIPYAVEEFGKGIEEYRKANGGSLPPDEKLREMALMAGTLVLAEYAGDVAIVGKGLRGLTGKAAKEATEGTTEAARKSLKSALKGASNNAATRIAGRTAAGGTGEFGTEAYQTYAENEIQGKDTTLEDAYVGGAIGAISGGGMAGGISGVTELAGAGGSKEKEREDTATKREAQTTAIQSGDVSALVDPKSPTYSPANAVAALQGHSKSKDATPESRQQDFDRAQKIVTDLEEQAEKAQAAYDAYSPESNQAALADAKARLAKLDPANTEARAALEEEIELTEQAIASTPKTDPKVLTKLRTERDRLDRHLKDARSNLETFNREFLREVNLDEEVATVQKVDAAPEARRAAADRVINLAMAAPERLAPEVAARLASEVADLTDVQRNYLRAFSDSRIAANELRTMGRVSQEIYTGSDENVGISQYEARMAAAIRAGNEAAAQRHLRGIEAFAQDHAAKAEVAAEAWKQGQGTQIQRTKSGEWAIADASQRLKGKALKRNGGLDMNTPELVSEIRTEADALNKAAASLKAAYAVRFNKPATKGATNVSDVSRSQAAQGTKPVGKPGPVSAPAQAGKDSVNAVGPVPGGQAGDADRAGSAARGSVEGVTESTQSTGSTQAATAASSEGSGAQQTTGENQSTETTLDQSSSATEGTTVGTSESTADVDGSTVDQVEESTGEVQSESGKLSVLAQKSPEGTLYKLRNLIADFFSQSSKKDGDVTERPLVVEKDFLSKLTPALAQKFLSLELDSKQADLITFFKDTAQQWDKVLQKNIKRNEKSKNAKTDPREFWFSDLMQFFLQETGGTPDLEENVKTAIFHAAFSYVAEKATDPMVNDDAEINQILNRDEHGLVNEEERRALKYIGTRQNVVINSLGQKVMQALGLKANQDAKRDLAPKLESAFGSFAMKLLIDEGILVRDTITGERMAELTGNAKTSKTAQFQFLKLNKPRIDRKTKKEVGNPKVEKIYQASRGTAMVLDKLFGVEPGLREPSLKPVPFDQKTTKNTRQGVPALLKKILSEKNAEENFVRQDMWNLLGKLKDTTVFAMSGVVEVNEATTHKAKRDSIEAKNDGLIREYDRFMDFVGSMTDTQVPIFFEHSVWKQQRVGIATNVVNPQSSKVHRHLIYKKAWETKVDPSNTEQMENFQLRVLEGFGVKTDKQANVKSLEEWGPKVKDNAKIQAAVDVLVKAINDNTGTQDGKLSDADQATLIAGVKEGGENMHSLDALMALAQERIANGKPFTVTLMGEVDGVTNGPMLSHLLLGAAATVKDLFDRLNRGGFFQQGSEHTNYNVWRGSGGKRDLYEDTISKVLDTIRGRTDKKGKDSINGLTLDAVYRFTGPLEKDGNIDKAGRNIIKTPLTAMVFGSSLKKAVDSMANDFIEKIYERIESIANGKPKHGDTFEQLVEDLAQIGVPLEAGTTIKDLMDNELSASEITRIKKTFMSTIGNAVVDTMKSHFSTFIDQRKAFNEAAEITFLIYNSAYEGIRDEFIAEQIELEKKQPGSGIAFRIEKGKEVPIHDLTAAQETEIRKRLKALTPLLHTPLSKMSNSPGSGLYISKSGKKISTRDMYRSQTFFGSKFPDGTISMKYAAYEVVESNPGVAMLVLSAHSADSAISHTAAQGNPVLNVHDAHGAGIGMFEQTARNLNKATWEVMLEYSPGREMVETLERTIKGMEALLAEGKLPPAVLRNLAQGLVKFASKQEDMKPRDVLRSVVNNTRAMANHADRTKLEAMSQMVSVDQYALEGGNYEVTDADRQKAAEMLAKVGEADNSVLSAVDKIVNAVVNRNAPKAEETEAETESNPDDRDQGPVSLEQAKEVESTAKAEAQNQARPNYSVWGDLGQPAALSDPQLVGFFEQNQNPNATQVIRELNRILQAQPQSKRRDFNLALLKKIYNTGYAPTTFRYVTPSTPESEVLEKPTGPAHGWFVSKGDAAEVYLLSPDFVHSGLTAETVLHELVHATVANIVENELEERRADPEYRSNAMDLIDELEALRQRAAEQVASLDEEAQQAFQPALKDVHEFIAWGMTNAKFQRQVLNEVRMESKNQRNRLVTGLRKFVEAITGILFSGSSKTAQEIQANGMTVLVTNVAGLFEQAAEGTQSADLNLSQASVLPAEHYTTAEIHEALSNGQVSAEFSEHLSDVLDGIVQKLHGPFGAFAAKMRKTEAKHPLAVWLKALETGSAPFASEVVASPLRSSAQEDFVIEQVEATVRAALETNETQTRSAFKELYNLYSEVQKKLSPKDFYEGDWNSASQAEKAHAKAQYDFLFKLEAGKTDRSNYLARFAALGLANERVNSLLKIATDRDHKRIRDGESFGDRLQIILAKILEFFGSKITKTYAGQPADSKLSTLVGQLVDIEAKHRSTLSALQSRDSLMGKLEDKAKDVSDTVREKVVDLAGSRMIRNSRIAVVKGAGAIVRTVADQRVEQMLDIAARLRDRQFKGRQGVVAGLINDVRGPVQGFERLLRERKRQEKERKGFISNRAKQVLQAFANGGTDLSTKSKEAITAVFLRSGAHVLLDRGMTELDTLISDESARKQAIIELEAKLRKHGKLQYQFIEQANVLGYYNATGSVRGPLLMLNANNIARGFGTFAQGKLTEEQVQEAIPTIEALVALYTIGYTDATVLERAQQVLRTENLRTDGNGVEFVLKLQRELEKQSKERLFDGNPTLMQQGYVPEILDPHVTVKTATEEEGQELINQGYVKGARVAKDPADRNAEAKYLYVLKGVGLQPYLSGAISLTALKAKGSMLHSGFMNPNTVMGLHNAQLQAAVSNDKANAAQATFQPGPKRDLSKVRETHMIPEFNDRGQMVNHRYVMANSTRDTLLRRDNRMEHVLGAFAGSIYDKVASSEQNANVIQALREQFDAEYTTRSESYVIVGANSTDPEFREIWDLLPQETKDEARRVFGFDGMQVRSDSLDIIFGYRKLSLATMFQKDPEARGRIERFVVRFVESNLAIYARTRGMGDQEARDYAKQAAAMVTRGERVWQEFVHEAKDIIVIKTGVVLLGNIWSNFSLLAANGVGLKEMLHHHNVALRGALSYQQDAAELDRLETMLATGYTQGNEDEIRREIVRLKDSLARNPVKELIDAGLMPTIVEDVSMDDDPFTYKSELVRRMERITDRMNPRVVKAVRGLYMAHDTKLYQGLSRTTQLSDFVARYTLYQHLTTRKKNPLSKQEAIQQASDSFINYDIPMHRSIQYMDDMGLIYFTKYFLRIQRVLLKLARDNPLRVMMMVGLQNFMDLGPIVLEGSALTRFGNNPLESGAWKFVESLDEMATVAGPMALIK